VIDIVSIGMVTAVGLDAPSACAAMRARLDGFQETRW
jgi:3-oxoacyl-[acyl-carrier-protein] synthase I